MNKLMKIQLIIFILLFGILDTASTYVAMTYGEIPLECDMSQVVSLGIEWLFLIKIIVIPIVILAILKEKNQKVSSLFLLLFNSILIFIVLSNILLSLLTFGNRTIVMVFTILFVFLYARYIEKLKRESENA